MNPRLKQKCVICVGWGQHEPNCAHGFDDGVNPGSLYFVPARVRTIEVGIRASKAITEENRIGHENRVEVVMRTARMSAA